MAGGFNGAALERERKGEALPRGKHGKPLGFNGAALERERKDRRAPLRGLPRVRFNGAALERERKA